jgi:hypothetical protein
MRNFARGAPPPPGSHEYLMVGDLWDPEIAARKIRAEVGRSSPRAATYTDYDAAKNYVEAVERSARYARQAHGDRVLSAANERELEDLSSRWRSLASSPSLDADGKAKLDGLLDDLHRLHDRFVQRGMAEIPVPYAGELALLLRSMPKELTAAEMRAKLEAGAKCGDRLLDRGATWWRWITSRDHAPLEAAVARARAAAAIYGRSRESRAKYRPGDPAYDEFLRRLTLIWIEAAGLYGIRQVRDTAWAQAKDDARRAPDLFGNYVVGLLAAVGVAYLGTKWILSERRRPGDDLRVAVPDAYTTTNEGI